MERNFYSIGVVFNVKLNTMKICLSIIVSVANLKIQSFNVILSLILVENLVKEREELIVLTYVPHFVIVENANLVNIKVPWLNVTVVKLKEWRNAVNKELHSNVVNDAKKY